MERKETKLKTADKIVLWIIDAICIASVLFFVWSYYWGDPSGGLIYMLFLGAATGGVWVLYLTHMLWLKLRYNISPFATSIQSRTFWFLALITVGYIGLWMHVFRAVKP